jgi:hypothetical protein
MPYQGFEDLSFDAVGTQNVSFSLDEMTFKHFVQSNSMVRSL